MELISMFVR